MRDVIFSNTIQGAFQHVKIYPKEWTTEEREKFRLNIRRQLDELVEKYSVGLISSEEHISILDSLASRNNFAFGVAQKLLNLYLKYLWCVDEIKTPPHCPVDSRILAEVNLTEIRWSKMDRASYENALHYISEKSSKEGFQNISEWELETFNKTNQYRA